MARCFLMDIDGTLADCTHRLHLIKGDVKHWDAFFKACVYDAPIHHMITLCRVLARNHVVVFVSGRSDVVREETRDWLRKHRALPVRIPDPFLYMREAGDHRPDDIVKGELLETIRNDGFEPIMAFDDRNRVVEMWRKLGVPCAQVADGDF